MVVRSNALSRSITKSWGSTITLNVFSRLASSVAPKPLSSNAGYPGGIKVSQRKGGKFENDLMQ
jgi:hypothetical protein